MICDDPCDNGGGIVMGDLFDGLTGPAALSSLSLPEGLRVLVVGPHPDDFDANGVTLRYLSEIGSAIRVSVVITGSGVEDSYCSPATLEVKERIREAEQRESCRFFGLPEDALTFLRMDLDADAQPLDSPPNQDILAGVILPFRPELVILPHGNDSNQGHRVMHSLVRAVLSRSGFRAAMLLSMDPKTISMRTDLYMPFDERLAEWKAALLRFHDSQHQRNLNSRGHGFDERILAENRRVAAELALEEPYAEAFEVCVVGN